MALEIDRRVVNTTLDEAAVALGELLMDRRRHLHVVYIQLTALVVTSDLARAVVAASFLI